MPTSTFRDNLPPPAPFGDPYPDNPDAYQRALLEDMMYGALQGPAPVQEGPSQVQDLRNLPAYDIPAYDPVDYAPIEADPFTGYDLAAQDYAQPLMQPDFMPSVGYDVPAFQFDQPLDLSGITNGRIASNALDFLEQGKASHPDEQEVQDEYDLMIRALMTGQDREAALAMAQSHLAAHRLALEGGPNPFPEDVGLNARVASAFEQVIAALSGGGERSADPFTASAYGRQDVSAPFYDDRPRRFEGETINPATFTEPTLGGVRSETGAIAALAGPTTEADRRNAEAIRRFGEPGPTIGQRVLGQLWENVTTPQTPLVSPYVGMSDEEEQAARAAVARGEITEITPPDIGSLGFASPVKATGAITGAVQNIRLSKYPDDIAKLVKDWAEANPDTLAAARRGVRPDAEVLADAKQIVDDLGGDFSRLQRRWKPGDAWNAEEVTAIRGTLRAKTDDVLEAATLAKAENSTVNQARLLDALMEQARVQEIVHGVTAESGRALRAFRQEAFDAATAGDNRKLEELLRRVGGRARLSEIADALTDPAILDDPVKVANLIRNVTKPKAGDYLTELWINSILSGPKTHLVNSLSNMANAAMSPIERGIAAAVDVPLSRLQGRSRARFFEEVSADISGALSGIDEGVRAAVTTLRNGITPAQASKWEFRPTAFKGVKGRIIRAPGTALEAADSLFYSINHQAALNANIVRQAKTEGLKGSALVDRIADLKLNPTQTILKQSADMAEYRLFRKEPGKVVASLMAARDSVPGARFVVPFLRTPANLLQFGLERSPIGVLNPSLWHNLANKSPEAADQIARIFVGSSIAAGIASQVANGNIEITGAAPESEAERDRFYREGKLPFAIKVGGHWIQYQRLEPWNQALSQVAAVVDAVRNNDNKTANEVGQQAIFSIGKGFISQTYMSGIADFFDAVEYPERSLGRYGQRQATGFLPFSSALRTAAQMTDPTFRQPRTLVEAFQANIPGLSEQVPPKLTAFGEEAQRQTPAWSPIQITPEQQTVVDAELERLGVEVGFVGDSIGGYSLSREQQADYQVAAGKFTSEMLARLFAKPSYQALGDGEKAKVLDKVVTAARDVVRDQINKLIDSEGFQGLPPELQREAIDRILRATAGQARELVGVR